ncbi:hypothetical protein [Nocardia cerradoensis]|uniref:hypothetical protein n=1 Tax=Nocardia cerradoensis TaxID=85688 RepID=UPI00167B9DDF|nr:hypothetical protein [Nocardia cerradoensis]
MRLRDAAAATTIAGVQNHFEFGGRQHRSAPALSIAAQAIASGRLPVPWDRLEPPAAVA